MAPKPTPPNTTIHGPALAPSPPPAELVLSRLPLVLSRLLQLLLLLLLLAWGWLWYWGIAVAECASRASGEVPDARVGRHV
jgi:hypothetical protein